jgi:post-segregation antitoxin (ccd killing protein)
LILEVVVVVSVDGLLDTHEVSVRARVESLREQAARVAVELGEAELALEHVAITRATLAAAIAGNGGAGMEARHTDAPGHGVPGSSFVPVWRTDLSEAHLPVGYRQVWRVVVDASGPVRAKELARTLGLEVSAAKVEGLRSKLKRLAARGWIAEPAPGAFAPASTGPASPGVVS